MGVHGVSADAEQSELEALRALAATVADVLTRTKRVSASFFYMTDAEQKALQRAHRAYAEITDRRAEGNQVI